jgi:hypothetical protein
VPAHKVAPLALAIVKVCVPVPGQRLEIALCPAQDGRGLAILLADVLDQRGQALRKLAWLDVAYLEAHAR